MVWLLALVMVPLLGLGEPPPREPVFVGLVSGDKEFSIGAYDSDEGWTFVDSIPRAPTLGVPLTVYGIEGRLGLVRVTEILRHSDLSYWNSVRVTAWTPGRPLTDFRHRVGVVVTGDHPAPPRLPTLISTDDVEAKATVAAFLKAKGLDVESPVIKQALRVDLDGDGQDETLICAEDFSSIGDKKSGPVYTVALIRFARDGEMVTEALTTFARFKLEAESQAEFERHFGPTVRYRFLAFPDVEGKGTEAIFLAGDAPYQTAAYVFTFDGARVERVLFGKVIF